MKLKIVFALLLFSVMAAPTFAQLPKWFAKIKGVELLKDTQSTVRTIFGKPASSIFLLNPGDMYEWQEGIMEVDYSAGPCGKENRMYWDVPKLTVMRIYFYPAGSLKPQELGIDLSGFSKHEARDTPGGIGYENRQIGLYVELTSSGRITSLEFSPADKYDYLLCRNKN